MGRLSHLDVHMVHRIGWLRAAVWAPMSAEQESFAVPSA